MNHFLTQPLFADMMPVEVFEPNQTFLILSGMTTLAGAVLFLCALVGLIYYALSRPRLPKQTKEEGHRLAVRIWSGVVFVIGAALIYLPRFIDIPAADRDFLITGFPAFVCFAIALILFLFSLSSTPKDPEKMATVLSPQRVALRKNLTSLFFWGCMVLALAFAFYCCARVFPKELERPRDYPRYGIGIGDDPYHTNH